MARVKTSYVIVHAERLGGPQALQESSFSLILAGFASKYQRK
jgi:hypothetical protein